jgi:hypothetical protein
MTCRQLRPYVVDFARSAIDAAAVESQVARHVRGCPDCRALLERERIMSAALRRMAGDIQVPPATAERESTLLTILDQTRATRRRPRSPLWLWSPALAATLFVVVFAGWRSQRPAPSTAGVAATHHPPAQRPATSPDTTVRLPATPVAGDRAKRRWAGRRRASAEGGLDASFETASFVAWPGAMAGPPLESGSVTRVTLPVSILPALGLWPPPSAGSEVRAEVLVGQDGFARAVRLLPD